MRVLRGIEVAVAVAVAIVFRVTQLSQRNLYCSGSSTEPQVCSHWYDLSNPLVAQLVGAYVLLILVLVVGIASAILYSLTRRNPWRLVLWGTSAFGVLFSFASAPSLGGDLFFPSLVLLVAAIFSLGIRAAHSPASSQGRL